MLLKVGEEGEGRRKDGEIGEQDKRKRVQVNKNENEPGRSRGVGGVNGFARGE